MSEKIIFKGSFLVAGIMCHGGCGAAVQGILRDLSGTELLPSDAELASIDAQPAWIGVHEIFVTIRSEQETFNQDGYHNKAILDILKKKIISAEYHDFQVVDEKNLESDEPSTWPNRSNILVNLAAMFAIFVLSLTCPPSLLLTATLTTTSLLTTAFTGRSYLLSFLRNLRNKSINDMSSTISLGWLLSVAHMLYHSFTVPLMSHFSMVFMSFIMPVILIAIVNGMDEIKRLVMQKSKTIHLKGMKSLFPQMAEQYPCYQLSENKLSELTLLMEASPQAADANVLEPLSSIQKILLDSSNTLVMQPKQSLKKGTLIQVKAGECFPVDCILIQGKTLVDASIVSGELRQLKQCLETIPAGAINLGQTVTVYAKSDSYSSTVNQLLFRSNRASEKSTVVYNYSAFTSLYTSLIVVSIVASVAAPLALGVFTAP
jgi:Cu+-exporting ATPase